MTFLEKAKEMGESYWDIVDEMCPHHLNLEEEKTGHCMASQEKCKKCWNREMPNAELENVKEAFSKIGKAISKANEHACKEDMNTAYNKGLNDAWELAKKITLNTQDGGMIENISKVFGKCTYDVLAEMTPQEALAKLKAYEEAQIEVGDVVYNEKYGNGIVTSIDCDLYTVVLANGDAISFKDECGTKTGKHIDISSILEQIGE